MGCCLRWRARSVRPYRAWNGTVGHRETLKAVADPDDEQAQLKRLSTSPPRSRAWPRARLSLRRGAPINAGGAADRGTARTAIEASRPSASSWIAAWRGHAHLRDPAARLDSLSERVARASEMLRTRVE